MEAAILRRHGRRYEIRGHRRDIGYTNTCCEAYRFLTGDLHVGG